MDDTLDFVTGITARKRRSAPKKAVDTPSRIPVLNNVPKRNLVVLVGWRIQFKWVAQGAIFPNFALLVEGLRADDGCQWTSSEISKVVPPNQLFTQNTIYEIRGGIDKEKCKQRGFDMKFVEKFKTGFPKNWREEIEVYIEQLVAAVASMKRINTEEQFAPNEAEVTMEEDLEDQIQLNDDESEVNTRVGKQSEDEERSTGTRNVTFDTPSDEEEDGDGEKEGYKSDDSFEVAVPSDWSEEEENVEEEHVERKTETPISEITVDTVDETSEENESRRTTRRMSQIQRRMSRAPDMAAIQEENSTDLIDTTPATQRSRNSRVSNNSQRSQNLSNSFDIPDLKRSKRGRLIKPRLAPGEHIFYDKDGDIVEVRQNVTRTHINPTSSQSIQAIAKSLGMQTPDSPQQKERRLSNINQRPQKRRSSYGAKKKPLVDYDSDDDYKSLDEVSLNDQVEPTPLAFRKQARRRLTSDTEEEEEEKQEDVGLRRSKRTPKRRPVQKKSVPKAKPVKRKSTEIENEVDLSNDENMNNTNDTTGPVKKRKPTWTTGFKDRLKGLVKLINPTTDGQWKILSENFDGTFSPEECKEQAIKMKLLKKKNLDMNESQINLEPVMNVFSELNNAKPKERGTLRYQQKENDAKALFYKQVQKIRNKEDKELNKMSQDSLDETMIEIAKAYRPTTNAPSSRFTPNKRQFVPIPVSAMRRKSSLAATMEDSFDVPDWSHQVKTRFRLRN